MRYEQEHRTGQLTPSRITEEDLFVTAPGIESRHKQSAKMVCTGAGDGLDT